MPRAPSVGSPLVGVRGVALAWRGVAWRVARGLVSVIPDAEACRMPATTMIVATRPASGKLLFTSETGVSWVPCLKS